MTAHSITEAVIINDKSLLIRLRPKEIQLLLYLSNRKDKTATRSILLQEVWRYSALSKTRTVDVHIAALRQKIGAKMIVTTPNGYRLAANLSIGLVLS